ncbi:MAG: hypothetical protein J5I91_05710 [Bacteroidetes bacterium]|nr:hypothetical protein [Bacteroidota bacterium]
MDIKAFLDSELAKVLLDYPDLFVVGNEHQVNKGLYVFILDGDEGLSIAQCGEISRKLMTRIEQNPEAEAERENFSFSITSPGAESPLLLPRQYKKHLNREFLITLEDNTKLSAKLKGITKDDIEVVTLIKSNVKGRTDKEGEEKSIPFNQIKESKIILSFK